MHNKALLNNIKAVNEEKKKKRKNTEKLAIWQIWQKSNNREKQL